MPTLAAVALIGMFIACVYACIGIVVWKELTLSIEDPSLDTDPTDLED